MIHVPQWLRPSLDAEEVRNSLSVERKRDSLSRLLFWLVFVTVMSGQLMWILVDRSPLPHGDSYAYLSKVVDFVGALRWEEGVETPDLVKRLTLVGRAPLYQLLAIPGLIILGLTEDAALSLNLVFLALVLICVDSMTVELGLGELGWLAALLVGSYPPVIHLVHAFRPHAGLPFLSALGVLLLVRTWNGRSVASAWGFGGCLAIGGLIHLSYLGIVMAPVAALVVGLYVSEVRMASRKGRKGIYAYGGALWRQPCLIAGVIPAAMAGLSVVWLWYGGPGGSLIESWATWVSPSREELWRAEVVTQGFDSVESRFGWYVITSPHALSIPLVVLAGLGLFCVLGRKGFGFWLVLLHVIGGYLVLVLAETALTWWKFASVLPSVAVLSLLPVSAARRAKRIGLVAPVITAVAVFNATFVLFGPSSWTSGVARALGAPLGSETCRGEVAIPAAYCPDPPSGEQWPVEGILRHVLAGEDPGGTSLLVVGRKPLTKHYLVYWAGREFPGAEVQILAQPSRVWGNKFKIKRLLRADYILSVEGDSLPGGESYRAYLVRFLASPVPSFRASHERVARFSLPRGGAAILLRRTERLSVEEAEETISGLGLARRYLEGDKEILASLYQEEARVAKAIELMSQAAQEVRNEREKAKRLSELGALHLENGDLDEGVSVLSEAVELDGDLLSARVRLSIAYSRRGQDQMAAETLEEAKRLAPGHEWISRVEKRILRRQRSFQ